MVRTTLPRRKPEGHSVAAATPERVEHHARRLCRPIREADQGWLYTLAAAVFIPALPTVLAQIPMAVVLKDR